jgi:predicted SAM-dependent methyltransferase
MKLHLGCGRKYIPGFIHVDALPYDHIDHVGPVDQLDFVSDESVSLIYASHILEHFSRFEVPLVLREWYRVLAPGGVLRLSVPDFAVIVAHYAQKGSFGAISDVIGLVCGGQKDNYDFHKMIFDAASLTRLCQESGFRTVRPWDWRTVEHGEMDDYSQAYLPHMDKENGRLMSLNLEAVKD